MKTTNLLIALLATGVLAACESEPGESLQNNIDTGNSSIFDPSNGVIPFPNDLLFQDSMDGTLNIPVDDPADLSDPQVALNGVDGFSTIAPFSTSFVGPIDPASVTASSVRVFEVTTAQGAVVAHTAELMFGVDYIASVSSINPADLAIVPLRPLKPKTSYQVVVTKGLLSTKGNPMNSSTTYALAKAPGPNGVYYTLPSGPRAAVLPQALNSFSDEDLASLEGLRQLVSTGEATAAANAAPALTTADITISWSFTTQSTTDVLSQVETDVIAAAPVATIFPGGPIAVPGVTADIYAGSLTVPYYLTAASGVNDPTPLGSFWKGAGDTNLAWQTANLSPVKTSDQTIPLLLSTPAGGCTGACPVVIYQHGITTNRGTMLAIADSMAAAGFAVIAIDLPMHGITGNETDGTEGFYALGGTTERTFDLDLVTQDADGNITAEVPDNVTDTSGRHFVNLTNLLNSRDNIRQAVADLVALRFSLAAIDYNGATAGGNLASGQANVRFLGHSLGGIIGLTFLAIDTQGVEDSVIAMSGGGIAKLLDGSASFGPTIAAGLATNGVLKGSSDFESFLGAAQTAIDSGDPINHTAAAAANTGILFYEVVGGGGNPSDLVVPNRVPDGNDTSGTIPGPLSGTDPLVGVDADVSNPGLGLTQIAAGTLAGPNPKALMRFNAGDHGSLLSPASSLDVTTAMQTDAGTFFATGSVVVSNSSLLVAP
jgi:dienelactone hydrolase